MDGRRSGVQRSAFGGRRSAFGRSAFGGRAFGRSGVRAFGRSAFSVQCSVFSVSEFGREMAGRRSVLLCFLNPRKPEGGDTPLETLNTERRTLNVFKCRDF
jgi:hypothetical protein